MLGVGLLLYILYIVICVNCDTILSLSCRAGCPGATESLALLSSLTCIIYVGNIYIYIGQLNTVQWLA